MPAYRLRITLAAVGLAVGVVGVMVSAALVLGDGGPGSVAWLVGSALLAAVAALNIVIVNKRRRHARAGRHHGP